MNKPKKPKADVPPIFVRASPELKAALVARAELERRTVTAVVEAALAAYLARPVRA